MKKVIPLIYITFGSFILIGTFFQFFQNQESYRVLFNFKTENKYIFLLIRLLFSYWFIVDGIKKLKQQKES